MFKPLCSPPTNGWERVSVGQIATVVRGTSPRPKGDPRYYGGPIPRLLGEDVSRDGQWVTPRLDSLTKAGARLSRWLKKGSLVLVCSGTVGVPCFLAVDACIHDGFLALTDIDESRVSKAYLYWWFSFIRPQMEAAATHGGVFTNLTTQIMRSIPVDLPPLAKQRHIVNIITSAQSAIQQTEQLIAKLNQIKTGLLHDMLTHGLDAGGKVRDPSAYPEQVNPSPSGHLPVGWQRVRLSELGEIITGTTPPGHAAGVWGEGLPFITPGDISEAGQVSGVKRHLSRLGQTYVRSIPARSILVVCIGSTLGKIASAPERCAVNQQINALIPAAAHHPTFVRAGLCYHMAQLRARAGRQALPIINKTEFGRIRLPIAPASEQAHIAAVIEAHEARIQAETAYQTKLTLQKQGLMADLLTGRLLC